MPSSEELARAPAWKIYEHPNHWPVAAGHVSIINLLADAMWARFGVPLGDSFEDADSMPLREWITGRLAEMIANGGLKIYGRPIGGGELQPVIELDLSTEIALSAVATGNMEIVRTHETSRHWIFVGELEASILLDILTWEIDQKGEGLLERLTGLALRNLSGLAGNAVAAAPKGSADRILSLLLPTLRPRLERHDRTKLIEAAKEWLLDQFKLDPGYDLFKDDYRTITTDAFGPFLTDRMFDDTWRLAADKRRKSKGRRAGTGAGGRTRARVASSKTPRPATNNTSGTAPRP